MPVTDSRVLFRLGKRYRGFVNTARGAVPVTFNVYPLTPEEVRLKHLFPTNIAEHLEKGSVVLVLIENEKPMIGELRRSLQRKGCVVNAKGRIVRSTDGVVVVEFEDSDPEMTDFIGRVYADVFLLNQRGG